MLSYQHVYHAGNNADCHKHALQAALLENLRKDKAPFLYIDTHAGRGLYNLAADKSQKLQEYRNGIQRLWADPSWPREAAPYRRVVESLNRDSKTTIKHYPGSPWVAEALRRPQDHLTLYELHPLEYKALEACMGRMKNVSLDREDGWSIIEHFHSSFTRGLIAIDPSYELKTDYSDMAERVRHIVTHYPGFILSIWYPILAAGRHTDMTADLEKLELPFIKSEIDFPDTTEGMTGSRLFIIHPPVGFEKTEKALIDWLKQALAAT